MFCGVSNLPNLWLIKQNKATRTLRHRHQHRYRHAVRWTLKEANHCNLNTVALGLLRLFANQNIKKPSLLVPNELFFGDLVYMHSQFELVKCACAFACVRVIVF